MDIALAYNTLYIVALIILALLLFACLLRAIAGPKVADRLVATNMMGTIVMVIIAILALMLCEGYLLDICIIYGMISFIAVVMLSKVYIGVHKAKKEGKEND